MVVAVRLLAAPELEKIQPSIDSALRTIENRLNELSSEEVVAIVNAITRALDPPPPSTDPFVVKLLGGRTYSAEQRVKANVELLTQQFAHRRELLEGSLTASAVAQILGTTRQTPHDRVKAGTLLAVFDHGAWRFPEWQFDPAEPGDVIKGLPEVIRALDVTPLAKVSWLTRPNDMLDGATPLHVLKSDEVQRVVRLARAVGVW